MTTLPVKAHAELGASGAERWMNCAGSVRLSRGIPNLPTEYSLEGTAAHALAERCLRQKVKALTFLGAELEGIEVTEDMVDAVQVFLDFVDETLDRDKKAEIWIEQPLNLAPVNPPAPMFGTADVIVWLPRSRTLVVLDYKHGQGYAVDVQGNAQVRYYAVGAVLSLPDIRPDLIETVIVQPRASHPDGIIRSDTISAYELLEFIPQLMQKAEATLADDAPLTPGRWCRFCRAAPICPALAAQAQSVAQIEFADAVLTPPNPDALPQAVLLRVLEHADVLDDWLKSVRSYVQHQLESGEEVPGWKLVQKRANRKWVSEALTADWAKENGLDEDELFSKKIKSPAQIEKVVGKKALPDELVMKPDTGYTMAPQHDARPAVNLTRGEEFATLPPASE